MALYLGRIFKFSYPLNVRSAYGRCRIGNRDVVGFGVNGSYNYRDDPAFPFPSIRFKENTREIAALREKEKCDWRQLSCEEKKALYRASFCSTYSEFMASTGNWKFVAGWVLIAISGGIWLFMFARFYVDDKMPSHICEENLRIQLRRMLELHVNPIDGLSSKWDYDKDKWK